MSVYQNVSSLIDTFSSQCNTLQRPTGCGIFSSKYTFRKRRKLVHDIIWRKLLDKKKIHCSDDKNHVQSTIFALLTEHRLSHSYNDYKKCLEIVQNLSDSSFDCVVLFLLLLNNNKSVPQEQDGVFKPNCIEWRFKGDIRDAKFPPFRSPFQSLDPLIDWKLAESFSGGQFYRTWDLPHSEAKVKENDAVIVSNNYDYWHRSRTLISKSCFGTVDSERDVDNFPVNISPSDFRSACISLLMGCSSDVFYYDESVSTYHLAPNIFMSGVGQDCLENFSRKFTMAAEKFRSVLYFVDEHVFQNDFCVVQWYRAAVSQLVHIYLDNILQFSDNTSSLGNEFIIFSCLFEQVVRKSVDMASVYRTTDRVRSLIPRLPDDHWCILNFLYKEALFHSWKTDQSHFDRPLVLEQFLFAEATNPLLSRLSRAVFSGLSKCTSLQLFGIVSQQEFLAKRNLEYWTNGFVVKIESSEIVEDFTTLVELMVSAGRSIELLKICSPSHYLITHFNTSSPPLLEFIAMNEGNSRQFYLSMHEIFHEDLSKARNDAILRLSEIKKKVLRAVVDKVNALWKELKERDEFLKAQELEKKKLKFEKKKELRNAQLAETAARQATRAAAKEKEREADLELARRLAEEDFTQTEYERRLGESEKQKLVEYYAELETQAEWRRAKAEWRTKRFQLAEKRLTFLESLRRISEPVFDDAIFVAERASPISFLPLRNRPRSVSPQVREPSPAKLEKDIENSKTVENPGSLDDTEKHVVVDVPAVASPKFRKKSPDQALESKVLQEQEDEEFSESDEDFQSAQGHEVSVDSFVSSPSLESEIEENVVKEVVTEELEKQSAADRLRLFDPERPAPAETFQDIPTSTLSNFIASTTRQVDDKKQEGALTFTELFEVCVLNPARAISNMASLAVVEYLRDELDLVGHLSALRRYMLMDAGEFAIAISLPICDALRSTKKAEYGFGHSDPVGGFFLETTLNNAVRYASSPLSRLLLEERSRLGYTKIYPLQVDLTKQLKFSRRKADFDASKPFCFDALELSYTVGWPLNIVLPQEDMLTYSKVFSFLLEIVRVVNLLDSCLQILADCQQVATKRSAIVDTSMTFAALRRAHHARCLMRFFFTAIQNYLSSYVIRPQWEKLREDLGKARCLDDLRLAHVAYLKNLEKRCFLTDSTKTFRSILRRLIRCVLDFESELKKIASSLLSNAGPVKKANVAKIQAAANDFRANSAHFVSVAALRVSQYDRLGFLDRLLSQLTFNEFYNCDTTFDTKGTFIA